MNKHCSICESSQRSRRRNFFTSPAQVFVRRPRPASVGSNPLRPPGGYLARKFLVRRFDIRRISSPPSFHPINNKKQRNTVWPPALSAFDRRFIFEDYFYFCRNGNRREKCPIPHVSMWGRRNNKSVRSTNDNLIAFAFALFIFIFGLFLHFCNICQKGRCIDFSSVKTGFFHFTI